MVIGRLESFPKKSLHHLRRGSTSVFWRLRLDISFMSYASRWLDVIYSQAAHILVLWKTADTSVVLPASCPVRAGIHVMFWVNMANVLAHSCLFTYPADTFLTTCPKFTVWLCADFSLWPPISGCLAARHFQTFTSERVTVAVCRSVLGRWCALAF